MHNTVGRMHGEPRDTECRAMQASSYTYVWWTSGGTGRELMRAGCGEWWGQRGTGIVTEEMGGQVRGTVWSTRPPYTLQSGPLDHPKRQFI